MSTLYYFTPENDIALALNSPFFTPPAAAVQLRESGAALMAWLGNKNDYFIGSKDDERWIERVSQVLETQFPSLFHKSLSIDSCCPWGWSLYTRRQLIRAGVVPSLLPDENTIERIRQLGHRRISVKMYEFLSSCGLPYSLHESPVEYSDATGIETLLNTGENLYIKSPWSSSGRGVIDTKNVSVNQVIRMVNGMISHQGSVLVEKSLNKVQDFAMLYDMIEGKASFVGYSQFFNNGLSNYSGNTLCCDSKIAANLSALVPEEWIAATQIAVTNALEHVLGTDYSGAVGVDMLIYQDERGYNIAPCIEVNLRLTMGRVAHGLYENFIFPDSTGEFRLEILTPDRSKQLEESLEKVIIKDNKLAEGTIPLTPPSGNRFCFTMTVK